MPNAFCSLMLMKLPLAPPLPVPSLLPPMISQLLESSINSANYEMFDDLEKLSELERVALQ